MGENKFMIPHNALFRELHRSLGIFRIVKYRRIRRAGYLVETQGMQTELNPLNTELNPICQ